MRIRPLWVVLAILLVPAIATADGHRARFFGAYSLASGSVLKGAHVNFEYLGKKPEAKHFAAVVDYSVHFGDDFQRHTFTSGLSVSRRAGQFGSGPRRLAAACGGTALPIGRGPLVLQSNGSGRRMLRG